MSATSRDVIPRGLPEPLPANERMLWQGAPDWRILARQAFHVRKLAAYFGLIVAWVVVSAIADRAPPAEAAVNAARAAGLGAVPVLLVMLYAWIVARTTVYTITDRRLAMRIGLALPTTINLPFARIEAAGLKIRADGTGDISLSLIGKDRLAYLMLWPHSRPWRFSRTEPTLRSLRDARPVALLLARSLAASADMAAPVLHGDAVSAAPAPHSTMLA